MKRITAFLLTLILVFTACALLPLRAASLNAFIDSDSYIEVGDEFRVVVRFEADAEAMVDATLSYDSSVVTFLRAGSSDANESGGVIRIVPLSAKTSHRVELYFKMKSDSAARFSVQVNESFTLDMTSLGTAFAERTVNGFYPTPVPVTPTPEPPTPTPTPTPTPFVPTVDPNATPSMPLEFMDGDTMRFIAENFDDDAVEAPEGFERAQYDFKGYNISVFKNAHNIILIYATDIVGRNGSLYIYSEAKDVITPYRKWTQSSGEYTFLIYPGELPEGFIESSVIIGDDINVTAYAIPSDDYAGFLLIYACVGNDEPAFYLYDTKESTMQRFVDAGNILTAPGSISPSPTVSVSPSPSAPAVSAEAAVSATVSASLPNETGGIDKHTLIYAVLGFCAAAALVAVIIIIVKSRKIREKYEENYDDTDEIAESSSEKSEIYDTPDTHEASDDSDDTETESGCENNAKYSSDNGSGNNDNNDGDEILQLRNNFTS